MNYFSLNYQHTKTTEIAHTSSQFDVKDTIKTLLLQKRKILFVTKYSQAFKIIKLVIISNAVGILLTVIADNK